MRSSHVRCTALVPVLALAAAGGCSNGGTTGPAGTLGALGAPASVAGTWVYRLEDLRAEPMLAGGPIVADTLRLRATGLGTWSLVSLDPADAGGARHRNDIPIEWTVRRDTLWVMPTCEPRELCDPLPAWRGTMGTGGQLVLLPTLHTRQTIAPRVYERVAP